MMWYGNDPGWGGWLLMTLGMLAFWVLIVAAVIAFVRALRDDGPHHSGPVVDPRALLDERFARGEIDAEEYRQRRELLSAGR
ncbi:MAG TPA: SHOCT domain-containing protein [Nocardioidaceae bacterium]|nr:SHOCT domain-containing protein [Nocardioidaceae bacterium]